jgi:hypothetical protein
MITAKQSVKDAMDQCTTQVDPLLKG